jgi:osmotically inducible lipoprotein OsmB
MNNAIVRTTLVASALAAALSLTACAGMSDRGQNTAVGAAVGGVAGSVLTGGSTVGTVGGAVIGGVIGNEGSKKR